MSDDPDQDKLDDLAERIHQAEVEAELRPLGSQTPPETEPYRHAVRAYRVGTDFAVTVLASLAIGWAFDHWVGTAPWGLLFMMVAGFAAAFVNLLRASKAEQNNGKTSED